jgi:hypothetical protein
MGAARQDTVSGSVAVRCRDAELVGELSVAMAATHPDAVKPAPPSSWMPVDTMAMVSFSTQHGSLRLLTAKLPLMQSL